MSVNKPSFRDKPKAVKWYKVVGAILVLAAFAVYWAYCADFMMKFLRG